MGRPPASRFARGRHAGVIVPLFSIPSRASWGIGEIADLPHLARWLAAAGLDFVQLLPINEMERGQRSPYSALSAMAMDPIFITVEAIPDFIDAGGRAALPPEDRALIGNVVRSARVQYEQIRPVKHRALRAAFDRFQRTVTDRTAAFEAFIDRERWWLADYALFRALHEAYGGRYWREWEIPLRDRDPHALDAARDRLGGEIRYYEYLQWIAGEQWQHARDACRGVGIFGDFPFMVNGHSADVWARQQEFRLDASVGVPPDPSSPEGQDWGFPACRWDVMASGGYRWFADRTRRSSELFDGFRVDHLVGFYRTYVREHGGRSYFSPPDEASQIAQGEALMSLFRSRGCPIIAEDLGVVPDMVRESQARNRVPGLRVLRWEREWRAEGQPFRDPARSPACSVAISGTHDTESQAEWWDGAGASERAAASAIPALREAGVTADVPFSDATRDALLTALFGAGSDFVLAPLADVFGWRDRINDPAVASDANWTWRLPWPLEEFATGAGALERAGFLRRLAARA